MARMLLTPRTHLVEEQGVRSISMNDLTLKPRGLRYCNSLNALQRKQPLTPVYMCFPVNYRGNNRAPSPQISSFLLTVGEEACL